MSEVDIDRLAAETLAALNDRTVALAESLTGGLISAALTAVPGASKSFRGSVVSYATDVKVTLLGVSAQLIADGGAVQEQVALQMALGVSQMLSTDFGLAVTGVAGPTPQDGNVPGAVFVAVVSRALDGRILASKIESLNIDLAGVAPEAQRAYIRAYTVERGLNLLKSMAIGTRSE